MSLATTPWRRRHGNLVYLLAALSSLGPFCIDAYLPSLPEISRLFAIPMEAAQQTLTAYMATFALMTLWHGAISDAIGRRRVVLVALALFAVASLGCALSQNLEMLLVFRGLQGMTAGTGMVVGRAIVRDLHEGPEAQKMLSVVSIVFAIAPSIAPVIGGWLHHFFGWRAVFVFMGVFAALLWFWCFRALAETLPAERRQPFKPGFLARSYARVMTHPPFVALSVALALTFGGFFVYVLSAPVFLMQHLGVAETDFLWLFGPATVGMVCGAWLSGRIAGVVSPTRTALLGCGAMAVAAFGNLGMNLLVPPGLPWSVLPIFVYVFGMALAMPSLTLMALDLFPAQRGLAASCQSFIQSASNSLLAAFVAPLAWATPLRLSLGQAVLFAIGGAAVAAHVALLVAGRPLPAPPRPLGAEEEKPR